MTLEKHNEAIRYYKNKTSDELNDYKKGIEKDISRNYLPTFIDENGNKQKATIILLQEYLQIINGMLTSIFIILVPVEIIEMVFSHLV